MPSVIEAEVARQPVGYLERIIEMRRYAEAWHALQAATTGAQRSALRTSPMGALAEQIMFELVAEEQAD